MSQATIAIAAPARPWTEPGVVLSNAGHEAVRGLGRTCPAVGTRMQGTGMSVVAPQLLTSTTTQFVRQDHPPRESLR
jgi:hypothetical protein